MILILSCLLRKKKKNTQKNLWLFSVSCPSDSDRKSVSGRDFDYSFKSHREPLKDFKQRSFEHICWVFCLFVLRSFWAVNVHKDNNHKTTETYFKAKSPNLFPNVRIKPKVLIYLLTLRFYFPVCEISKSAVLIFFYFNSYNIMI